MLIKCFIQQNIKPIKHLANEQVFYKSMKEIRSCKVYWFNWYNEKHRFLSYDK